MGSSLAKKAVVLICALVFCMVSVCALAADKPEKAAKPEKQWYVYKDKNGVCYAKALKEKPKNYVAGPFPNKEEAQKAKAEKCQKPPKKTGK